MEWNREGKWEKQSKKMKRSSARIRWIRRLTLDGAYLSCECSGEIA